MTSGTADKKITVAGLGLIGGSVALSLKRAGYAVSGWNRSQGPRDYAMSHGVVDAVSPDVSDSDIIFVCLPPRACVSFIEASPMKDGAYVYDICGVKRYMEDEVGRIIASGKNIRYAGCHPMAGREVSGVENASADLFDGASMILTRGCVTDGEAYETLKLLTKDMGFARLVECPADCHDRKIAYTSQLAHIVSNSYVKNREITGCHGFTGGSFQDMTRIAGVDERVWSELYSLNADNLLGDIEILRQNLDGISRALRNGDSGELERVLKVGRELFEEGREFACDGEITVTELR